MLKLIRHELSGVIKISAGISYPFEEFLIKELFVCILFFVFVFFCFNLLPVFCLVSIVGSSSEQFLNLPG